LRGGRASRWGEAINLFDFLVAGAGSAGCIVARVLAQSGYRVAIVEAADPGPPMRRPAEYLRSFGTDQDWQLKTEPQKHLASRQLIQPRGRGPGGSTRINAMIWYPPRSCDLDTLVAHSGGNLDRQSLVSSLDAVTSWVGPQPPRWLSDATRQYLRTTTPAIESPHAFLRMGNRAGRITAADLMAGATLDRGSVETMIAHVTGVVFNGDRAIGLEVRRDEDSSATVLSAEKGVILCGGTFASPAILMKSGIGPAGKLADLNGSMYG
jgi:choline dehydrogenase